MNDNTTKTDIRPTTEHPIDRVQRYAWNAQPTSVRVALIALYIVIVTAMAIGSIAGWMVVAAYWSGGPGQ
jgi:hypothetical protein